MDQNAKGTRWGIDTKRRKVLVDGFQLRFASIAAFYFLIVVMIFVSAVFAPIIVRLGSGDLSSPEVQAAAHEFLVLHTRIWVPLLGAFALLVVHNILVTHRVAGPLVRFRHYFNAVANGDLSSPIRLRKADYLKREAAVASHMVESLRAKVDRLAQQIDQVNEVWTDLRSSLAQNSASGLDQKISMMGDHVEGCMTSLSAFKTGQRTPTSRVPTGDPEPVEINP